MKFKELSQLLCNVISEQIKDYLEGTQENYPDWRDPGDIWLEILQAALGVTVQTVLGNSEIVDPWKLSKLVRRIPERAAHYLEREGFTYDKFVLGRYPKPELNEEQRTKASLLITLLVKLSRIRDLDFISLQALYLILCF